MKSLLFIVLMALFFSPKKDTDNKSAKNRLPGCWIYNSYEETDAKFVSVYVRAVKLKRDHSGLTIRKGGILVVRQNASWCGTPPITYKNYSGSWNWKEDSTLTLKHNYWGGAIERDLKIVSLTKDTVKMIYLEKKKQVLDVKKQPRQN